ncbi:hypothetical protein CAEBREN_05775 [Caenorhabditis brenneri]|uniref:Uncharacterized protein n=1 Tax=Caenorhabditis brenneri TaxID=135651 RepID=G0M7I6_CAEBE|nr:hypothetical protein CAEBREN_05775 [Caenorhabditis brenneri]
MLSNGGIPPNGTELHDGEEYNIPVALRQLKDPITEPYHIKCETIVIPPINPNLEFMNEEKYRSLKKEDFANDSDIATRKCVLRLIQEKPELWARKKVRVEVGKWEEIAIELFKRFGALCDIDHIRQIFGLAKQELREKLIESIKAKDDQYETERKLAEWVLYYDIRYYREVLKELEDNLRSQTSIDKFEAIIEADAPCHLDGIVRVREVTKENGSIEKVTEMLAPLVLDKK